VTPGARGLNLPRRLDEVDRVLVVLLEAGGDGEDVRIEDDVERIESGLFRQQRVGALADGDFAFDRVRLPLFVKRHDDNAAP
jgi:hypothetical protein